MTLWTFGDSFTENYKDHHEWSRNYIEFKGYVPKSYSQVMSEMLDCDLENHGGGGFDNYSIFETICENAEKFFPGDTIIVNWSDTLRFRLAGNDNQWGRFVPNNINFDSVPTKDVCQRTFEEIIVNREHHLYVDEVNKWISLLNVMARERFTMIHWTPFDLPTLEAYKFSINETIKKETMGKVNDHHYNEKGQILLAGYLLGLLNNPKKLI